MLYEVITYRQLRLYVEFSTHNISSGVRSNCKLAKRKSFLIHQYIFFHKRFIIFLIIKITTGIGSYSAVLKFHRKIFDVITSYSIHYTKLYDTFTVSGKKLFCSGTVWQCSCHEPLELPIPAQYRSACRRAGGRKYRNTETKCLCSGNKQNSRLNNQRQSSSRSSYRN